MMGEEARAFITANKDRPFFLYFAPTVPHAALQVPEDSLAEYLNVLPDTPYAGDKGYLPHRAPHAAYAAMVTRLDREVGRLAHSSATLASTATRSSSSRATTGPRSTAAPTRPSLKARAPSAD